MTQALCAHMNNKRKNKEENTNKHYPTTWQEYNRASA
jgi:hypothetical protein